MRFLNLSKFRNAASLSTGKHASVFSGEWVEFWGLRTYSETDDARAIDWKASLRSWKTLVKTFVPDREIAVWCVLDVSAPMGFWSEGETRFDMAVSVFELISASAIWSWNRAWAIAYAGGRFRVLKPTLSHSDTRRFVAALREDFISSPPEFSPAPPWPSIAENIRTKSAVFFVSDAHPNFPQGTRALLRRSHVFSIRISHPYDSKLPKFWIPAVWNGFFARLLKGGKKPNQNVSDSKISFPHAEISVADDPFPALNRLLSSPHA